MENEVKEPKTHLNYGLLTGVILIVLFVLFYVFGLYTNKVLAWIPTIIFIVLIIIAQLNHAKALDGNITYGNLFAMGFKTTAVAVCIYVVFMILFIWLVPEYKEQMAAMASENMVKKGMTQEQINAGISMYKKFFTVSAIGGTLVIDLIIGVIASLIGAAIAKKNPHPQSTLTNV